MMDADNKSTKEQSARSRKAIAAADNNITLEELALQVDTLNTEVDNLPTNAQLLDAVSNYIETTLFETWRVAILERIQFIENKIGPDGQNIDPEVIKQRVLEALGAWQNDLKNSLDQHTSGITNLVSNLAALQQRIDDIVIPPATDPEVVKQLVLTALAAWQAEIANSLGQNTSGIANLTTSLAALQQQVDGIVIPPGTDPEVVKQLVLTALSAWQNEIANSLGQNTTGIASLTTSLAALQQQVDGIVIPPGSDPEVVKQLVLTALAAWQAEIANSLGQNTTGIANLTASLAALQQQVDGIVIPPGSDPEVVKQLVLTALSAWQAEIANSLGQNTTGIANLTTSLAALQQQVDGIVIPPGTDLEAVKQLVLTALAAWQAEIANSLGQNTSSITNLTASLAALQQQVDGIVIPPGSDPEVVKQLVLTALTAWQAEIANSLGQNTSGITSLTTSLAALQQQVDGIVIPPGSDPEVVKQLVLTALAAWQAEIANSLDQNTTGIANLTTSLAALQQQVDGIVIPPGTDPEVVKQLVLTALAAWQAEIANSLGQNTSSITSLTASLAALQQQVDGIVIPPGTDPEVVKQLVLTALAAWQAEIANSLGQNTSSITSLTTSLAALQQQVDGIVIPPGTDPEAVKQLVLTALAAWQAEIANSLGQNTTGIANLTATLAALQQQVDGIVIPPGTDPEAVKQLVLTALAAWQAEIANSLGQNTSGITSLTTSLAALQQQVDGIVIPPGSDPEVVKQLVLTALAAWQNELVNTVGQNTTGIASLTASLAALQQQVDGIVIPPGSDPEVVKQLVLTALAAWQAEIANSVGQNTTGIASLTASLAALQQQVDGIAIPPGTDPEVVKQLVLTALAAWQAEIANSVGQNTTGIASLTTSLAALQQQVDGIVIPPGTDPEVVKQLVLTALASWQNEIANSLGQNTTGITSLTASLATLQAGLNTLAQQFTDLAASVPVPEQIIQQVTTALESWKSTLENQLNDLFKTAESWEAGNAVWQQSTSNALQTLQAGLSAFTQQLADLAATVPAADQITQLATEAIATWKSAVEHQLNELFASAENWEAGNTSWQQNTGAALQSLQNVTGVQQTDLTGIKQDIQVLTAELEQAEVDIEYLRNHPQFEQADRLARKMLVGHGIVQGLEVMATPFPQCTLNISAGARITSEGHLIQVSETVHYTHYRPFAHTNAYAFLKKAGMQETSTPEENACYDVWELLPANLPATDKIPLTPQRTIDMQRPFIVDKVVLVLRNNQLPATEAPPLYFVLVRRSDLIEILQAAKAIKHLLGDHPEADFVYSELFSDEDNIPYESDLHLATRPELLLHEIPLHRFGFRPGEECSPEDLDKPDFPQELTSHTLFETYQPIVNDAFTRLEAAWNKLNQMYRPVLFPLIPALQFQKQLDLLFSKWALYQKRCEQDPSLQCYIQYFYDWARDLINAYHELRDELEALLRATVGMERASSSAIHPDHLMLGIASSESQTGLDKPLRHGFYQPPVFNGNASRYETCRLYFRRWLEMVDQFSLPGCFGGANDNARVPSGIRITPGKFTDKPLSEQSIPYYYPLSRSPKSLQQFWNYRRAKTLTEDHLLSYHATDRKESYTTLPEVIRPLYYTLDKYDFYRIEGHVSHQSDGYTPLEAEKIIRNMIAVYNLDFEVVIFSPSDLISTDLTLQKEHIDRPKSDNPNLTVPAINMTGFEHRGGVPRGGTFVLVADSNNKNVIADFCLPYRKSAIAM